MMERHITRVSEAREEAVGTTLHHVQGFNWRIGLNPTLLSPGAIYLQLDAVYSQVTAG
jgi:hypothetical protein